MDQNQNSAPNINGTGDKSVGPIIGTVIIIFVLVMGALYFWGSLLNKQSPQNVITPAGLESTSTLNIPAIN